MTHETPHTDKLASTMFPDGSSWVPAEDCRKLELAVRTTLYANRHLADGDVCTLADLKRAINFEFPDNE